MVRNAILSWPALKPERFAADTLLILPEAARVIRANVVEPGRERGDFVGLVPWHDADVVVSTGPRAPLLVVRHEQEAVTVVAALLFGPLVVRLAGAHAVNRSLVVQTRRVRIFVAVDIRHEAALVVDRVLECARANGNFVGEVSQESVRSDPVVAEGARPIPTVDALPLSVEVPSERNRLRPENTSKKKEN